MRTSITPTRDPLRAYARVHAFYQLLRFTSPPQPVSFIAFQAPFVFAALAVPSRALLAASAAANVVTILVHLPAVVDMDHWALHTDVAVLLALLLVDGDAGFISRVVRVQMAIYYCAAGVWKMTDDHADPRLSCSSMMLVQIMCGWLPEALLAPSLVALVVHVAPTVTLIVEMGVCALLLSPRRALQQAGVLLALALHVGIMIAPPPLSIADFGALSASRLFWLLPEAGAQAVGELAAAAAGGNHSLGVAACVALVAAVGSLISAVHGSAERVLANVAFCALAALLCRAMALDGALRPRAAATIPPHGREPPLPAMARALRGGLIVAALVYGFGLPMLGLLDVGASTMFSHIKQHGGNSHAFLPVGLLQRWLAHSSPADHAALGPLADLAGGVVRVEHSTSHVLNSAYPGEVEAIHPEPLARRVLRATGHEARLFTHPGVRARNLRGKSLEAGGGLTAFGLGLLFAQGSNGADGKPFVRYTLPAFEVRMMLEIMRREQERFTLVYTRIAGSPPHGDHEGAEAWRAHGCGLRVTLHETPSQRACSVVDTCSSRGWLAERLAARRCDNDELVLLDAPSSWLARTLLLSNPYPILEPRGRYCGSSG